MKYLEQFIVSQFDFNHVIQNLNNNDLDLVVNYNFICDSFFFLGGAGRRSTFSPKAKSLQ